MGFVANFMENTTVKEFPKSVNICQSYVRMYSGTVFFDSLCRSSYFFSFLLFGTIQCLSSPVLPFVVGFSCCLGGLWSHSLTFLVYVR